MRFKKPLKITSRTSTLTNCFVQAIVPTIEPDPEEHRRVLAILGIDPSNLTCAYCGDAANHWDHLNPYVRQKRPTGFLNEARNIVPACGPCNTSKSGQSWRVWMVGNAKGSPVTRKIANLDDRLARLDALEAELGLAPVDFGQLVDPHLWQGYWQRLNQIEQMMFEAQRDAEAINHQIKEGLQRDQS